ncbi:MAG: NAD(P)-dependent oxidoreductase, partial [Pedobacter sp.]
IKPGATAARDFLDLIKEEKELDWTFFSPALEMHPGITTGRTGKYRLGKDQPVFDENNECKLSVEDLAVVILDEAENPKHSRARFTAAY